MVDIHPAAAIGEEKKIEDRKKERNYRAKL